MVEALEERVPLAIAGFSASAAPLVLYPPNGRYVPVTLVGSTTVRDMRTPPIVTFKLVDEYRKYEPRGRITPIAVPGNPDEYRFQIRLRVPASVAASDKSGRQFYLVVASRDPSGTPGNIVSAGKVIPLLVPNPDWGPPRARRARR